MPGQARHDEMMGIWRGPLQTRFSPALRFPTAILITGMMIVAFLSFAVGLILDTVVRGRREVRRLHYLSLPAVGE
jgi:hypothetical protein